MKDVWNPWHGCKKYSEGCEHCYVYRRDESVGVDASVVRKTAEFDLPVRRGRDGAYKLAPGGVFACMTSDFFLDEADDWRGEAWAMIRARPDVHFSIITKRIARFAACLPPDWGDGYPNVRIGCTVENQRQCDFRMPIFQEARVWEKFVICEPLLGPIRFAQDALSGVGMVVAGGESGSDARECDYEWVLGIREQCVAAGVPFHFKQTGERFVKDGKRYRVPRAMQLSQARKAAVDWP